MLPYEMERYNGSRTRGSVLHCTVHRETATLDLPDELITIILAHLNLKQLAAMHMVSQRFNRLLSLPDPSLRLYGSVTFNVGRHYKGSLPPSLIERSAPRSLILLVLVLPIPGAMELWQ